MIMTEILIIIVSFSLGAMIATSMSISVHRRHKNAWQDEYRRLMGGIRDARRKLRCKREGLADKILRETYNGVSWPRE